MGGCSTEKDTFVHRAYHNTTARYNGYYYAELSINKGLEKIREEYEEDYSVIIPVFDDGDESSASVAYPEMDRAIKKLSKVIDRHSMEIRGKQKCKWIDDSYLLLGRAYYYKRNFSKAKEMFTYVSKQYHRKPIRPLALIWLARTHIEAGELDKARNVLQLIQEERVLEKRGRKDLKDYFEEVYAQLYIEQEDYKKAAQKLESAIEKKRWLLDRDRKERLHFILGQIYHEADRINKGNEHFASVVNLNPPYEMAFQAKIKQALSYQEGTRNTGRIKRQLLDMLKDEKNVDFYDQIYFALAEIELTQGNEKEGVRYLKKSVEAENISKPDQRTEALLKLGDIHFEDKEYEEAQEYYQSAVDRMEPSHDRYLEVERRAGSLKELVEHMNTIEKQDSLLAMSKMGKEERREKIEEMIEKKVEKAEEAKKKKKASEQELKEQNAFQNGGGNTGSTFYFYNQKAKSRGYNKFQQIWGDRQLQDNWRRESGSNQSTQTFEDPAADSLESEAGVVTDPAYYEKDLPISQEAKKESKKKIAQAMYDAALIYREDLDDPDQAAEMFSELAKRFELNDYTPPAYYQLYRIYLNKEKGGSYFSMSSEKSSDYYKQIILEQYPESSYAKLIRNPDGGEEDKVDKKARERYERVLSSYQKGRFSTVIADSDSALSNGTGDRLRAKYMLLKGLALGRSDSLKAAKKVLNKVVDEYGDRQEGIRAKKILEGLKKSGGKAPEEELDVEESPFSEKNSSQHYFCIVLPKGFEEVDEIKNKSSDFNQKYFSQKSLSVSSTFLRNKDPLIMVKKFSNKKEGMDYYRTFIQRSSIIDQLNMKKSKIFIIAQENFGIMFRKEKSEAYMEFFRKLYLEN